MNGSSNSKLILIAFFAIIMFTGFGCSGGSGGNDDDDLDCSDPANATDPACEINCDDPENLTNPRCMITRCEENPDLPECEERVCFNPVDCDGDGLSGACDADDYDGENLGIRSTCDADGDGHIDVVCTGASVPLTVGSFSCDNCIGTANPDQADADGDGFGDACDSLDCVDGDGDFVCDNVDNCPEAFNPDQTADIDDDGIGDDCDADKDGDGLGNEMDNCPDRSNAGQTDMDDDSLGDVCDDDRDGDGVLDVSYPDGTTIDGGADECPSLAPTPENLGGVSVEETVLTQDPPDSGHNIEWTGCGFDTDGDEILDTDECGGRVLMFDSTPDSDCDGGGDIWDDDDDNDGIKDIRDLCPTTEDQWLLAYHASSRSSTNTPRMDAYFDQQLDKNWEIILEWSTSVPPSFRSFLLSIASDIESDAFVFQSDSSTTNVTLSEALNYSFRDDIRDDLVTFNTTDTYAYIDEFQFKGIFVRDTDKDGTWDSCDSTPVAADTWFRSNPFEFDSGGFGGGGGFGW